jgi:hypothetical protein
MKVAVFSKCVIFSYFRWNGVTSLPTLAAPSFSPPVLGLLVSYPYTVSSGCEIDTLGMLFIDGTRTLPV